MIERLCSVIYYGSLMPSMKNFWDNAPKSMRQRLRQATLIVTLVFILVFIVLVVATSSIPSIVNKIVDEHSAKSLKYFKNSRDFSLMDARLRVLQKSFFRDQEYLEKESDILTARFKALSQDIEETGPKDLLVQLTDELTDFTVAAREINTLLEWRTMEDRKLNDYILETLRAMIARGADIRANGETSALIEQGLTELSDCRETLLLIGQMNAEEDFQALLNVEVGTKYPLATVLSSACLSLSALEQSTINGPDFVSHLRSDLNHYQKQMLRYAQVMSEQGRRIKKMHALSHQIIESMKVFDDQRELIVVQAKKKIRAVIQVTLVFILLVLLATALFFSLIYGRLFTRYFQLPMERLCHRLVSFEAGDMFQPMALDSEGEWLEVESGFNRMLVSLQQKVGALVESEARYREIFTNAMEAIFRIDLDLRVLELNPMAVDLLGYASRDDALTSITDIRKQLIVNPEVTDGVLDRLFKEGRITAHETQVRRKDGSHIWVILNAHLIRDEQGQPLYFEGTARDVESEKLAQEKLQRMQAYLQNVIDSQPSILIAVDTNLQVTLWNNEATKETGVSADDALGLSLPEVFQLFNINVNLPQNDDKQISQEPIRLINVESRQSDSNVRRRYFDVFVYPLTMSSDDGLVIHIDDVSERVKLETMMVRAEKMRSVGNLASGLAHEINNPLAVILQNAQVLMRRFSPDLGKNREAASELGTTIETIRTYLEVRGASKILESIAGAGQRAAKIVENIQSFSRSDMSSFTPCSLELLLEQTLELAASDFDMRKNFNFQKIKIVREYTKVESIVCEPSQIQQVILTLLKNAAQAMSQDKDDSLLILRIFPKDKHACLQIEDNGAGMTVEATNRAFDPFYTTRDVGSGTGLGLSIAYFIVTQNHSGYLEVHSELGKGSCFDILLPYANAAMAKEMLPAQNGSNKT
jgi:PAS domain S-box-containing protein